MGTVYKLADNLLNDLSGGTEEVVDRGKEGHPGQRNLGRDGGRNVARAWFRTSEGIRVCSELGCIRTMAVSVLGILLPLMGR